MCFVLAGIQPKTRTLDNTPRRCPNCGLHQVYTRQVDHYLSLFFLPLLRVKKGAPFLYCQRCELPVKMATANPADTVVGQPPRMCSQCRRTIEPQFVYCPYCGKHQ